ncbi:MAG: HAMP domain-containing sensor histidine kinase [Planctomycetota bacterium]
MGRLLLFGEPDSLLGSMLATLCPQDTVLLLEPEDPFAALAAGADISLLLLDLGAGDWQPDALITAVRRRNPDCPILAIFDQRHRGAARSALKTGADAILPDPFSLDEFSALILRMLGRRSVGLDRPKPAPVEKGAAETRSRSGPDGARTNGSHTEIADLDALSIFVRGLAHEVNNPLTTIRGFLQLLLHDETGTAEPEALEAFQTMESESRRIADVIQELEYFSGIRRPSRTILDASSLVRDALRSQNLGHIEPSLNASDLSVLADREQLTIALQHLFGYLASSSPDSPPAVRVAIDRTEDQLMISAAGACSSSSSVSPEQLLVPLYAGRTTDPSQRRSLACVFGIARAHGGSLSVGREGKDGLVFRLGIPLGLRDAAGI